MTTEEIQVSYLRGAFRARLTETGDYGAAMFRLVKIAREDCIPDALVKRAVADLRAEGLIP